MLLSFFCQRSPTKGFKPFPANQKVGKQEYHWVCSTLYLSSKCLDSKWTPNKTQSEGRGCMCVIFLGYFDHFWMHDFASMYHNKNIYHEILNSSCFICMTKDKRDIFKNSVSVQLHPVYFYAGVSMIFLKWTLYFISYFQFCTSIYTKQKPAQSLQAALSADIYATPSWNVT